MGRPLQGLIGTLFLIVAAVFYFRSGNETPSHESKPPVASESQYDWVNIFDKQVKINNGGIATVRIHNAPRVRILLTAEDPVKMALVQGKVERNIVQAIDSGEANCSEAQASSVTRECDLPSGIGSLLILYKDGSKPEQTLNIAVDAWQCKANCQ